MSRNFFYAVRLGRENGIFLTWDDAKKQVDGFSGAQFKKFRTRTEANNWLHGTMPHVELKPKPESSSLKKSSSLLRIYVDGACSNNGRPGARAGIGIFIHDEDPRNVSHRVPTRYPQTNQVAELLAALKGVEIASSLDADVVIVSDSIYAVKSVNSWRDQWKATGWKKKLVNKELLKQLSDDVDARLPRKTIFEHVLRDSCEGNRHADALAKTGTLRAPE